MATWFGLALLLIAAVSAAVGVKAAKRLRLKPQQTTATAALLLLAFLAFGYRDLFLPDDPHPAVPGQTAFLEAQVLSVTDGDTFRAKLPDGTEERIRLLLIDTPETKHASKPVQPFGPEASVFAENMLLGNQVHLEFDVAERDQYGRLLAYVYIGYEMLNERLLEEGLARVSVFQPNVKYVERFRHIQQTAREQRLGVWSIENYVTDRGFNERAAE